MSGIGGLADGGGMVALGSADALLSVVKFVQDDKKYTARIQELDAKEKSANAAQQQATAAAATLDSKIAANEKLLSELRQERAAWDAVQASTESGLKAREDAVAAAEKTVKTDRTNLDNDTASYEARTKAKTDELTAREAAVAAAEADVAARKEAVASLQSQLQTKLDGFKALVS